MLAAPCFRMVPTNQDCPIKVRIHEQSLWIVALPWKAGSGTKEADMHVWKDSNEHQPALRLCTWCAFLLPGKDTSVKNHHGNQAMTRAKSTLNSTTNITDETNLVQNLARLDKVSHFLAIFQDFVANAAAHILLLGKVLDIRMVEGVLNLLNGTLHGPRKCKQQYR